VGKIPVKIWFLDTNILAQWILGKGGVLKLVIDEFELIDSFLDVYNKRYKTSNQFITRIMNNKELGDQDEFNVSYLAVNELFSAIRDELRSVILFSNTMPISRWRDPRLTPEINQDLYDQVFSKTLESFDALFENNAITFIDEVSPTTHKDYLELFSSIIFSMKNSKTFDATLLTTAILSQANYFVTNDTPLIKMAKNKIKGTYGIDVIKPGTGIARMNKQRDL